jgi:homopolymeric O-antigen transport system ATP-binding protein
MRSNTANNGARPAAIVATGLSKHYRLGEHQSLQLTVNRLLRRADARELSTLEALVDVDFSVGRGEAIGIVGRNGSGKSTLLQILSGTTLPTAGEMRVYGRVLPLLAVGQGFHPELTGRENVTLFASSLGIPRNIVKARMLAVTEFAGLERHMDTPVKRFSFGMASRLSFAIAMQFPADTYVFDEVLAVVDQGFQERCIQEIRSLHHDGRTVIFVSHSLDQVEAVCDRVMWLRDGRVERIGDTAEVLRDYASDADSAELP